MAELKQRVALVTGASRGLGRAIAIKLARKAGRVGVHYYRERKAALGTIKEIKKLGADGYIFQADLSSLAKAIKLIQKVEKKWGRIDILVNNFGPFFQQSWEETSPQDWLSIYKNNVIIPLELMKAVVPGMKARKWGRIINLGFHRVGQMVAFPRVLPYASAKTALLLITRTAASTLFEYGITVNMVSPGLIEGGEMPEIVDQNLIRHHLGRAEDVATAVAFLASDEAQVINGVNLVVAGTWKI
ncbi:MAG: SDR family oxidoreductase [Candidatus Aminicenantes bacterium]|nr:SDR family oxidoreductase [Candidatus Aminicenantes bacterium]